ncbi:SDR family oxidoreductase [Aquitalea sp. ASV15]|uniref:SDR family oxidoreductase n=1 Tax=Aquitalea sp. ASV15 TaxID=2795104 RepID=UPI0018EAA59D|nr:SDR family oxidoreductase [Aquitalea sp. ASV15]
MRTRHSLQDQTVVIIGGSSGLGLASAQAAIHAGARVIIGSSSTDKLQQAVHSLGQQASSHPVDVLDAASIQAFFAAIPALDHLLITAAVIRPGLLLEADITALQTNLDSRFWGSVHSIRAAAPRLAASGSITLTSGMVTQRPQPGKALAAVAAGAVETLAHSLVAELAPRRINVISPGPMHTPLLSGALGNDATRLQALAHTLPLKRLGEASEFAEAALFLMANPGMNGEVLHLNGGAAWA